jgi:hypothetical protein
MVIGCNVEVVVGKVLPGIVKIAVFALVYAVVPACNRVASGIKTILNVLRTEKYQRREAFRFIIVFGVTKAAVNFSGL